MLYGRVGLFFFFLPCVDVSNSLISCPFLNAPGINLNASSSHMRSQLFTSYPENSSKPCDTGSDRSHISKLFPNVDFSTLDPKYPSKDLDTPYAFTRTKVLARGNACLRNLYHRKEKVIAVVSHSGFLRTAVSHVKYANADYRVFDWREGSTGSGSISELIESPLTRGRAGMGRSESGRVEVEPWDFPSEEIEEVKDGLGEKSNGEATSEVPA